MTATTSAATRLLITGAAGGVGTILRTRLAGPGRIRRLLDLRPLTPGPDEEFVAADLADADAVHQAAQDVDAIVHLGGHAKEAAWEDILRVNVGGTRNVLEAAREHGIDRVVIASSFHSIGWLPWRAEEELPAATNPAPDSLYGWSKSAMESLGRLYADRFGMRVFCLRIGTCTARPRIARQLSTWLSPDDAGRLIEACLSTEALGYHVVWGISANTRRWWSLAEGAAIGYHPKDDAERYAGDIPTDVPPGTLTGGPFCEVDLGSVM